MGLRELGYIEGRNIHVEYYSAEQRSELAKADWTAGHFGKVPGDEIEFIPLPQR